jgi:hypothetical protein
VQVLGACAVSGFALGTASVKAAAPARNSDEKNMAAPSSTLVGGLARKYESRTHGLQPVAAEAGDDSSQYRYLF